MRVKRSPKDWPDQLLTNIPPARAGAISPPFNSAPWQAAHLPSNTVLPCAAWSAVKTPLQTVRAAPCAFNAMTDAAMASARTAMPVIIRGRKFLIYCPAPKDGRIYTERLYHAPRPFKHIFAVFGGRPVAPKRAIPIRFETN